MAICHSCDLARVSPRAVHDYLDVLGGDICRHLRHGKGPKRSLPSMQTSHQHSFFMSLHQVPRDLQFIFTLLVLKNCVPYSWSYTCLSFYPLAPNVTVNVLPQDWIVGV